MDSRPSPGGLRPVAVICCSACVSLGLLYYVDSRAAYIQYFPVRRFPLGAHWILGGYVWGAIWAVIAYVALPALVVACLPGERLRDYHLSVRGLRRHVWWYAALLSVVLPTRFEAECSSTSRPHGPWICWC